MMALEDVGGSMCESRFTRRPTSDRTFPKESAVSPACSGDRGSRSCCDRSRRRRVGVIRGDADFRARVVQALGLGFADLSLPLQECLREAPNLGDNPAPLEFHCASRCAGDNNSFHIAVRPISEIARFGTNSPHRAEDFHHLLFIFSIAMSAVRSIWHANRAFSELGA